MKPNVWTRACSSGGCVEVRWTSACANGSCVEVGHQDGKVLVRDSKLGEESPVIVFTSKHWRDILDVIGAGLDPMSVYRDDTDADSVAWVWTALDKTDDELARLEFTPAEWDEFVEGAKRGLFDLEVKA